MKTALIGLLLLCITNLASAQTPADLHELLPADNEVVGWIRSGTPQNYRGEKLFEMIDGGAEMYHEYGFSQVLRADYENKNGHTITLELYEMADSAAAFGIYSSNSGNSGQSVAIGQEAILSGYYLNFWKGQLFVTVIGSDSDPATIQGLLNLARMVARHYEPVAEKPALVKLLLSKPLPLTHPLYIRGDLGVMNKYVFDLENIFHVHEGVIGTANDYRVFVFRYRDEKESRGIYTGAIAKIATGSRFTDIRQRGDTCSMIDSKHESVMIRRTGQHILIVIGPKSDRANAISKQLAGKVNQEHYGSH
jgi:hypothetical protein